MDAPGPAPDPPGIRGRLVFLPGFMTAPGSYRALLAPLQDAGLEVLVPRLYRRGWRALSGGLSVAEEAVRACELVTSLRTTGISGPIWLGGHSRGGQAAWRCAELLATRDRAALAPPAQQADSAEPASVWDAADPVGRAHGLVPLGSHVVGRDSSVLSGLILVDPVDGSGRRPSGPDACARPASFDQPTLIIGAGRGGACAPAAVNHGVFAAAAPAASHIVVAQLGHADVLCGPALTVGRALCGGGPDPAAARLRVSALMLAAIASAQSAG